MRKKTRSAVQILGLVLILFASGCSFHKELQIDPGTYALSGSGDGDLTPPPSLIAGIEIDQQLQEISIVLRKGEPLQIAINPRPRQDWPAGCPGNLYSQRMEIYDLEIDQEAADLLGFSNPVLVRNCPEAPYQLVLRKDGEIGGATGACPYGEECLILSPAGKMMDDSCSSQELMLEECDRERSELGIWAEALVDGYGPGIWYFSSFERPLFHHRPQSQNLDGVVGELNELFEADQIPTIQIQGQSGSTVVVSVSDDRQLTQGMGSTGARTYLQVVLYSLASLPEIDCVDFQFQEGDHAQPGILCRTGSAD